VTHPTATVVVPAHNEEGQIGRLLAALVDERGARRRFDVVVVCNGCTDRTADVAACFPVRVLDLPEPSKAAALRAGDAAGAPDGARVYVDADVEIDAESVAALLAHIGDAGVLAAGPRRELPLDRSSWPVRSYYAVWLRLPQVRDGLFARGVIALSPDGAQRVRNLPPSMSDDLVISEAFAPDERAVVNEAVVVVHPPRTVGDLMRRRTRVVTGNAQAERSGLRSEAARTSRRTLLAMARREPALLPSIVVFAAVTLVARARARRRVRTGDFSTWLRDESSRAEPPG